MTDKTQSIGERYKNAKVVDAPTPDAEPQAAPAQARPARSVGERYAGFKVVDEVDYHKADVADATEQALKFDDEHYEAKSFGEATIDWLGDAGRATLFGPLADPIGAMYLKWHFRDKGYTYDQIMEQIEERHRMTDRTSATITGAIVGGGLVASGLKKGATWAATRSGIAEGAMKWAAKNKLVNRVVGAAAGGAAAGAVEEGIRTTLEESIDATAGQGFDGGRVIDNVFVGTLIGAAGSPILQEGMNGAKWFGHFLKRSFGNNDAQTYDATKHILRSFARDGEDLDSAADRFRQKVLDFRMKHGRMPAAAEVMSPEQVAGVAAVSRNFSGLDQRARELGEAGVRRALKDYDDAITRGHPKDIPSTEAIENHMEELFTDVITRNGDTLVDVPDETMVYLSRNRDWIRNLANNGNEGAERMSRIIDADAQVAGFKRKYTKLLDRKNSADAKSEVDALRKDLALLLDDAFNAPGADASDIAHLRNLIQLKDALAKAAGSERNATAASFDLEEFKPIFRRAVAELEEYQKNGLKIKLKDANNIRSTASRHFNIARGQDADKADAARRVRDVVAPIGKEVEEYGNVVKRWGLEMNRSEAQATGIAASRGDIDLQDLATRLEKGRLPNKPKASNPDQIAAIQKGAGEGFRRETLNEVRDTPQQGVRMAERMSESAQTQRAAELTVGPQAAKKMRETADMVVNTYKGMKELSRPVSRSKLAAERAAAADIITGSVFGNLGGAGRANLIVRTLSNLQIPKGTAKKIVEMLGNPDEIDKALAFLQKKNIRVGPLFSATLNHLTHPTERNEK